VAVEPGAALLASRPATYHAVDHTMKRPVEDPDEVALDGVHGQINPYARVAAPNPLVNLVATVLEPDVKPVPGALMRIVHAGQVDADFRGDVAESTRVGVVAVCVAIAVDLCTVRKSRCRGKSVRGRASRYRSLDISAVKSSCILEGKVGNEAVSTYLGRARESRSESDGSRRSPSRKCQ
jgi:hypothetical protein